MIYYQFFLTGNSNVLPFSSFAISFTNNTTTIRFPCQPPHRDDSGALVWKLRKCVITEGVGGKRSSVSGGMPKGRDKWVGAPHIKRSSGAQSPGSLTLAGASLPIPWLKDWKEPDGNTSGSRCLDQLGPGPGHSCPDSPILKSSPFALLSPLHLQSPSPSCHGSPWRPARTRCLPICCLW